MIGLAFGWTDEHKSYDFKIKVLNAESVGGNEHNNAVPGTRQHILRITEPKDKRNGKVDMKYNKDRVHSQTPEVVSTGLKLSRVFDNKEYGGNNIQLEYMYDFGTCWTHEIRLVGRRDVGAFEILEGVGHWVAEDVGGPQGREKLKEAYRAKHPDQTQKSKMKWFETSAIHSDPKGLHNGREYVWWEEQDSLNNQLAHFFAYWAEVDKVYEQVYGTG